MHTTARRRGLTAAGLPAGLIALLLSLAVLLPAGLWPSLAPAQPAGSSDDAITEEVKREILDRTEVLLERQAYASGVDFKAWPEVLAQYKARLDRARTHGQFAFVLNQAMREFGISHIDILPPSLAQRATETEIVGIGILADVNERGVLVNRVLPDSPAARAGLRRGDTMVEIDGRALRGVEEIRGPEGSSFVSKVLRDDGSYAELKFTRARVSVVDPATLEVLEGGVGLLRLPTFSAGYDRAQVAGLFRQVKERQLGGLIIDLRSNGGGLVDNMKHFLGFLLASGEAIGTEVPKQAADRYERQTGKDGSDVVAVAEWISRKTFARPSRVAQELGPFKGRVAVLIDSGSASASEIVAAAMRELREAPLIGTRTAGAVLVSRVETTADGFLLKVPVSDYVTIKGYRIEGNPLRPDVEASSRRGADAVKVALERLSRQPAEPGADPAAHAEQQAAEAAPR